MRDWKEVFEKLSAPFGADEINDLTAELGRSGKARPYAPIDAYLSRLGVVLGEDGFRVEYERPELLHMQREDGTRPVWAVNCKLTLLDEGGRYHCSCTCPGTSVVQGDADSNVATALRKARADALKACCGIYRVGGDITGTWEGAHGARPQSRQAGPAQEERRFMPSALRQEASPREQSGAAFEQPRQKRAAQEPFTVVPAGRFREGNNNSSYIPVTVDGTLMELWFYKEQNEQLLEEPSTHGRANRLDDLRNVWAGSGQPLNIIGSRPTQGGNKIYFRGLR